MDKILQPGYCFVKLRRAYLMKMFSCLTISLPKQKIPPCIDLLLLENQNQGSHTMLKKCENSETGTSVCAVGRGVERT